jgi:hypothetical protein
MHPILLNTNISQTLSISRPITVYAVMDQSPYGYWNQAEQWGSQNGLTYMWPMVHYTLYGSCGPRLIDLNNSDFPKSTGALFLTAQDWPGIGADPYTGAEIDGTIFPWNSATGYIGLTFGATGFLDIRTAQRIVTENSWIPEKYRVMSPYRMWRYLTSQAGISGTEDITLTSGVRKSHWIKRKISFMRAELKAFLSYTGSTGFYFGGGIENDDEYSDNFGFTDLRDTVNFPNQYVYPNNSATGSSWYASFSGQSAAPDSLIAEGITSFRSFLLTRGWTTNPASFKYIDGINASASDGVSGNIAALTSRDMWLGREFSSALKDWTAAHWQDLFDDFKRYNNHKADNNLYGSYGYYYNNAGISGYQLPNPVILNPTFLTKTFNIGSTDAVPYPLSPLTTILDRPMQRYYSYNTADPNPAFPGSIYYRIPGSISSLNTYGAFPGPSVYNSGYMLDRSLDYTGNSYYFANNGQTFGIRMLYGFMLGQRYSQLGSTFTTVAKKWIPANYLGTTTGLPKLVDCIQCSEIIGSCHFKQFDLTGSSGSTFPVAFKAGFDRAPELQAWHLNPVWGITSISPTASYGPANYIPLLLTEIISGLSYGQISLNSLGSGKTWGTDQFDACLNPYPGNTLPPGSLYNNYWTHWYPMHFVGLLEDVARGRHIAVGNVTRAVEQRNNPAELVANSIWNRVQKPINVWLGGQKYYGDTTKIDTNYYIPTGLTFGYYIENTQATGVTFTLGESGPLYYENIRHQYLNKVARYSYWSVFSYFCVTSSVGAQAASQNQYFPRSISTTLNPALPNGITSYGICGAIAMALTKKVNTVIGECNTVGNGLIRETVNLAPINLDERTYLASGAQKIDGNFLWRITFANPATDPSQLIIRGSCSGITTGYNISGITDYVNNPNNKFGVWWTTGNLEYPIVENPPIPEALRRGIVNLPNDPEIMYNAVTSTESRNSIPVGYENPDLFGLLQVSPYNWYKDGLTWGSQNGLTYMWPIIYFGMMGVCGPSRSSLDAGIYLRPDGRPYVEDISWAGIGEDRYGTVDLNNSVAPWTTATGYIGLTFGATGFFDKRTAYDAVSLYSWIPNKYRTFFPSRSWRAINGVFTQGLQNTEILHLKSTGKTVYTPWLKRKIEFVKAELNGFYNILGSCGFTMAHWEMDDEYYYLSDLRGAGQGGGDTGFYQKWLYPDNSSTSSEWYSSFTGICAAPDCFVAQGITSMRSFLLTRGWTSDPSSWKYVDGITALGNDFVSGNVILSGSPDIWLSQEYIAAMKDWSAGMMNDLANHFKTSNGIVADNSLSGNYGYYKTNHAILGYKNPSYADPSNKPYLLGKINWSNKDYIPYPLTASTTTLDRPMQRYYSFNDDTMTIANNASLYGNRVGDIDNIYTYGEIGGFIDMTSNSPVLVDRNLDFRGNSYQFANNGNTFGKNTVATWQMRYRYNQDGLNAPIRKWLPANYLNSGIAGELLDFFGCSETVGSCGFKDFDPTGSSGSIMCQPTKCGNDRAPLWMSWHLNPVWGINKNRLVAGATFGPANYIPIKGLEILNGRTAGSKTLETLRGSTTGIPVWNIDYFDQCGNPFPGNTLPAGTIYKHYWTHWYPMAFMALLADVKLGRHVAAGNVAWSKFQKSDPINYPSIPQSKWNQIQKPINTWVSIEKYLNAYDANLGPDLSQNTTHNNYYYVTEGITYGYYVRNATALGVTFEYGESGPMHFENIRHQYLNKTGRFTYWNPITYYNGTSSVGAQTPCENQRWPRSFDPGETSPTLANGLTFYGCCGAISYNQAKRLNSVIGECHTLGKGIVWETVYLAPVNMDERSYLMSGAQKVDGNYLWRITFAHPATQSPIIVRGSVSGITTGYNVNGITNYIYEPNSKFGIWWTTDRYEIPIVENPPVSEAERLGVLNLPGASAFNYNPLTMTQAVTP